MKNRFKIGLAITALAVSGGALVSTPAQAAESDVTILACGLSVTAPTKSGSIITGKGARTADCGTGNTRLGIQRSRWYGWEYMATKEIQGSGSVTFNCSGDGTHDYRTIQEGRTVGGSPLVKTSASKRFSC